MKDAFKRWLSGPEQLPRHRTRAKHHDRHRNMGLGQKPTADASEQIAAHSRIDRRQITFRGVGKWGVAGQHAVEDWLIVVGLTGLQEKVQECVTRLARDLTGYAALTSCGTRR